MKSDNRVKRLENILILLSKGNALFTPILAKQFDTTNKIIQTDLKDYLLPLFNNDTIVYDYSLKCYKAKNNFRQFKK